jgi:hypothetical protein
MFPAHMIAGFVRAYKPQTLLSRNLRDEGECCPVSRPFRLRLIARELFGTLRTEGTLLSPPVARQRLVRKVLIDALRGEH